MINKYLVMAFLSTVVLYSHYYTYQTGLVNGEQNYKRSVHMQYSLDSAYKFGLKDGFNNGWEKGYFLGYYAGIKDERNYLHKVYKMTERNRKERKG